MKVLIVLVVLLYTSTATAQSPDYEPFDDTWVGLSDFVRLAEQLGIELNVADSIDFSKLDPAEPVIVIYPKQEPKTKDFVRWVVDGGRMIMADDFGESTAFLKRLEIDRFAPATHKLPHDRFYDGNKSAPVFIPRGKHKLLDGVNSIVANHPTVIVNEGGPVVQYSDGGGLVYDMNLGDGKVIVISDPSLFINGALPLDDNARFAENAMKYICRDRFPCKVTLLRKTFSQVGTYRSDDPLNGGMDEIAERVNEVLEQLAEDVGTEFLYFLSLFLLVGLGVYLVAILPIVESRKYSGYISDFIGSVPSPQSEFDWNMSRFSTALPATQDVLPMSILKQIFEEIFLAELGLWPSKSEERPKIEKLVSMFSERYLVGVDAGLVTRDLTELLAVFATTPSRHRVFLENETDLQRGDLLKYHRTAIEILTIMGKKDEYDRRTWGNP